MHRARTVVSQRCTWRARSLMKQRKALSLLRQPRNLANVILVAFSGVLAIFWLPNSLKKVVL